MGLASKLAAAQAAGLAATPGYNPSAAAQQGQQSNPYGPPPAGQSQQQYGQHAQTAFPNQPPSQASYGASSGGYGAPQGQSSPYGGQPQGQSTPYGNAPPPVPASRPQGQGQQLPYPGQQGQQSSPYGGQPQQQQQYGANSYAPPSGPPPPQQGQYGQPPQGQGQYGAPQQSYGQQAPSSAGPGGPMSDYNQILNVLRQGVQDQKIHAFWPQGSLEPIAQKIAQTGSLAKLAGEWRLPAEVAMDLVRLALFDTVLYLDDSGSMSFEEGGSRIDDLKLIVSRVSQAASIFDDDGIEVRFMNSRTEGHGLRGEADAMRLISQVKFSGLTPLGTALDQKILQPLLVQPARSNQLRKPLLIIAVTDGAPGGEARDTLSRVIKGAKNELSRSRYGEDALSVQLAMVGNDMGARKFLEEIDKDPIIGGLVDTTGNYEQEQDDMMKVGVDLTPELWLVKLLLGPIDSSYDSKDE
ncbi:uncharacterized protein JCM6883_002373 [Sporobolomyces salmoneus]|uniref:uncharacterized protein n=1 Tax=Sporobolomyces salmoneus TaxID=183962 RepID=UPI00317A6CBE